LQCTAKTSAVGTVRLGEASPFFSGDVEVMHMVTPVAVILMIREFVPFDYILAQKEIIRINRLPPFHTTISAKHGEADAKEPDPGSRSTFTFDRKKILI